MKSWDLKSFIQLCLNPHTLIFCPQALSLYFRWYHIFKNKLETWGLWGRENMWSSWQNHRKGCWAGACCRVLSYRSWMQATMFIFLRSMWCHCPRRTVYWLRIQPHTHTHVHSQQASRIVPLPSSQSHGVGSTFAPRVVREPASWWLKRT